MQFKRIAAPLLALTCLCTSFNVAAYADTVVPLANSISPAYEIALNPASSLSIVGNTANCSSSVSGANNTISITITQTLQKHWGLWVWNDVENAGWTITENRHSAQMSNAISGLAGGTYRVKSVFTLTDANGKSETITVYSSEKKVG
ncbi:MAG: hypothetical protein HDT43_08995 [Ruminococcaceae bacterium]|nr:hypothetical protein [Oscillospiraceae bacterium]